MIISAVDKRAAVLASNRVANNSGQEMSAAIRSEEKAIGSGMLKENTVHPNMARDHRTTATTTVVTSSSTRGPAAKADQ